MNAPKAIREAWDRVGGLSDVSKMPGLSYGIPAKECQTGSKLRGMKGSTCSACYALKGQYVFPNVVNAQYRRMESIGRDTWVADMVSIIRHFAESTRAKKDYSVFRWHDSGDIQSVSHFALICAVAEQTPMVRHWLPTREYRYVREYVNGGGVIPSNLTVRISAPFVDRIIRPLPGTVTSSVVTHHAAEGSHSCPAPKQGNACADCRACWSRNVTDVAYHIH